MRCTAWTSTVGMWGASVKRVLNFSPIRPTAALKTIFPIRVRPSFLGRVKPWIADFCTSHARTRLSAPPATRPSLLFRLRDRRNHDAWSEFLQIYEPVIYRVAKRFQMQDADAREIVQEVLLRVSSAIDRFDPDGNGTFRGWLSQTTRRVAVDRFRRLVGRDVAVGGPTRALANVIEDNNQLEIEFDLEHRRQLFRCATNMVRPTVSPTSWSAFWETAVADRPVKEVALAIGLTEGAVYVARCRVLKRIREFIEDQEAD